MRKSGGGWERPQPPNPIPQENSICLNLHSKVIENITRTSFSPLSPPLPGEEKKDKKEKNLDLRIEEMCGFFVF